MDELLIELVHARRPIWDASDKQHCNRDCVKRKWGEIAEELSLPSDTVKSRWRNLRENYRKERNKLKTKTGQAAGEKVTVKWALFDSLDFLKDQFKPRPMVSNMCPTSSKEGEVVNAKDNVSASEIIDQHVEQEEYENDQSLPDDTLSNTSTANQTAQPSIQRPKQFKRNVMDKLVQLEERKLAEYERRKRGDVTDADYHFLMSLLPSLKKVTDERKLTVKRKLMDVFFEEELMYQHYRSTSPCMSDKSSKQSSVCSNQSLASSSSSYQKQGISRPSSACSNTYKPSHQPYQSPETAKTYHELQAVDNSNTELGEGMELLGDFFHSFNPSNDKLK